MKLVLLLGLCTPLIASAGMYVDVEIFAFNEQETKFDYSGLSPLASYSIKYKAQVADDFAVSIGVKHTSSVGFKENGDGFNGPFFNCELRLF